jgi:hypothetical protein
LQRTEVGLVHVEKGSLLVFPVFTVPDLTPGSKKTSTCKHMYRYTYDRRGRRMKTRRGRGRKKSRPNRSPDHIVSENGD